jgi:hypothetical protein
MSRSDQRGRENQPRYLTEQEQLSPAAAKQISAEKARSQVANSSGTAAKSATNKVKAPGK